MLIYEELKKLDPLSKQLIQQAKAFQTVVRLWDVHQEGGHLRSYNSLKACKGTMFFLLLQVELQVRESVLALPLNSILSLQLLLFT